MLKLRCPSVEAVKQGCYEAVYGSACLLSSAARADAVVVLCPAPHMFGRVANSAALARARVPPATELG